MNLKSVLIIDNYDSFTFNLVHYFEDLNCKVTVFRNDEYQLEELEPFEYIVLSPGPGLPSEAGLLMETIMHYAPTKKILGVCLGMQAIGEAFGATLFNLNTVFHGVSTQVNVLENTNILFNNLESSFQVGRYHSWAINSNPFPEDLLITAQDEFGTIMAIQHKKYNVCGVQFHPESILTPLGKQILKNWLM